LRNALIIHNSPFEDQDDEEKHRDHREEKGICSSICMVLEFVLAVQLSRKHNSSHKEGKPPLRMSFGFRRLFHYMGAHD